MLGQARSTSQHSKGRLPGTQRAMCPKSSCETPLFVHKVVNSMRCTNAHFPICSSSDGTHLICSLPAPEGIQTTICEIEFAAASVFLMPALVAAADNSLLAGLCF